jgi:hypothetical protein
MLLFCSRFSYDRACAPSPTGKWRSRVVERVAPLIAPPTLLSIDSLRFLRFRWTPFSFRWTFRRRSAGFPRLLAHVQRRRVQTLSFTDKRGCQPPAMIVKAALTRLLGTCTRDLSRGR